MMTIKVEKRLNWKSLIIVIAFCVIGCMALSITAEAATPSKWSVQSAQLIDEHHYYKLVSTLSDLNGLPSDEVTAVWSIDGGSKWNETSLSPEQTPSGLLLWNLTVNLPSKFDVDTNGVIFEFKRTSNENTEWLNNKGGYFTIGGKSSNVLLVQSNVLLLQPKLDAMNTLTGTVIVKKAGFRPSVTVLVYTNNSNKPIVIQAKRNTAVSASKNTLQKFEYTIQLTNGSVITKVKAMYQVNGKTYSDSIPNE